MNIISGVYFCELFDNRKHFVQHVLQMLRLLFPYLFDLIMVGQKLIKVLLSHVTTYMEDEIFMSSFKFSHM